MPREYRYFDSELFDTELARMKLNLSTLAKEVECHRNTLHHMINGEIPSPPLQTKIAEQLGTTPDKLWPKIPTVLLKSKNIEASWGDWEREDEIIVNE